MQRLKFIKDPKINDIVAHNTLWKSGMHTHYNFYKITNITEKGNIVGIQLERHINEFISCGRIVRVGPPRIGKAHKLKKVSYEIVTNTEHIFEEDCGYD
tara:strand:+ start:344 stop:640 length:297 start_codon:yes stop_codon:yes gene_type:complete